ncbi:MAG: hypothetical protein ACOY16_03410 [Chloroflexota bacterium]
MAGGQDGMFVGLDLSIGMLSRTQKRCQRWKMSQRMDWKPISIAEVIGKAGFEILQRDLKSLWSLEVEIVVGEKQG